MKQYHKLLEDILEHGQKSDDRTGTGTISLFGHQTRYDLRAGFPAVTTKKLAWKSVVGELLWFLEGSTDERRLAELTFGRDRTELVGKPTIWTANADAQGVQLGYVNSDLKKELGPVYGAQWRNFNGQQKDQIRTLLRDLQTSPDSRRLILSAWNPAQLGEMALPPCHTFAQFRVYNGVLSCQMYQRSADAFLGVPFNIASYALLTHIIAHVSGLTVGDFVHTIGDAHIYLNHLDQVKEQLSRIPFDPPELSIYDGFDLDAGLDFEFDIDTVKMFTLWNYHYHEAIPAKMAV